MNLFASAASATPITTALRQASSETGVGFDYLLKTAYRESGLEPGAAARTSSATGLFQFIEATWLQTVKEEGAKFGLSDYAQHIQKGRNGRYSVANPQMRAEILDLRTDPQISALMAGALTQRNGEVLRNLTGREPNGGELYIAHFLGAGEAGRLLQMAENSPNASAADAFPRAAEANRAIFYTAGGTPRTVAEVRDELVSRHDGSSGIKRLVGKIERKVSSFFASLFQVPASQSAGLEAKAALNASGAQGSQATARTAGTGSGEQAEKRLVAQAAYEVQLDWIARTRRPEEPVYTR